MQYVVMAVKADKKQYDTADSLIEALRCAEQRLDMLFDFVVIYVAAETLCRRTSTERKKGFQPSISEGPTTEPDALRGLEVGSILATKETEQ